MNIALAQSEIAHFLECEPTAIAGLWQRSALARTIFVEHRSSPELSHSSVYDVLQFYLRHDLLEPEAPESVVEAWLCAVDELVESDVLTEATLEDAVSALMEAFCDFSGQPCPPDQLARHALTVYAAYLSLLAFLENDLEPGAEAALPVRA